MGVSRGSEWGHNAPLASSGIVVTSDSEAREVIEDARRRGNPIPPLGLLGGDMCRTLGGLGDEGRLRSEVAVTCSVDIGSVLIDGRLHWFLSHLIARRSWWRGRVVAVMNAQWLGAWDLGPRAHPGDGLLDISDGDISVSDRLQARKRVRTGTHLPHPDIHTSRSRAAQFDLDPSLEVFLDGVSMGRAETISVRVEPDAVTVVV